VIGILIGTYSSIAIAAPILVAYQEWRGERGKKPIAMPLRSGNGPTQAKEKVKV
jgi:preprotein translocase subunit SecF